MENNIITPEQMIKARNVALREEYKSLCYHCAKKGHNLTISEKLRPENNGLSAFAAEAEQKGYKIGDIWNFDTKVANRANGLYEVRPSALFFEPPKKIKNPFAKKGTQKEFENLELSGFGLSLSIRGWSKLSYGKISMRFIFDEIKKGRNIENIWQDYSVNDTQLVFGGEKLPMIKALKSAGVNVTWYYKCCNDEEKRRGAPLDAEGRQLVFERLCSEAKDFLQKGVMHLRGVSWVRISDADLERLSEMGGGRNVPDVLHDIIAGIVTR